MNTNCNWIRIVHIEKESASQDANPYEQLEHANTFPFLEVIADPFSGENTVSHKKQVFGIVRSRWISSSICHFVPTGMVQDFSETNATTRLIVSRWDWRPMLDSNWAQPRGSGIWLVSHMGPRHSLRVEYGTLLSITNISLSYVSESRDSTLFRPLVGHRQLRVPAVCWWRASK